MNVSGAERKTTRGSIVSSAAHMRLSGSRLIIARAVWLALVVPSLGLLIVGFPVYYQQVQRPCVGLVACNVVGALTAKGLHAFSALGISASEYAAFNVIFWAFIMLVWSVIGFIIFWRRSDDWFALLAAFCLVMDNITYPGTPASVLAVVYPALTMPTTLMSFLGQISLIFFFLLFPNGQFVPRWIGLIMLPSIIHIVAFVLPPTLPFSESNWPVWLDEPISFVGYGIILFSQIYRYRCVSTPAQRQQTKWVVFAIVIIVTGFMVFAPLFSATGIDHGDTPYYMIVQLAYPLLFLLLPICTSIAILRYRLYDIDTVINRTLVYGLLTGILAAIYFGLIFGLQFLLRGIINSHNEIAIVISTLAIAALFQPLRFRMQRLIDRRFYRRKYDAARTLAAFSATLRNEVDLHPLSEHLIAVVEETMQPTHVSLWFSKDEQRRKPHTDV
jgi:hypothetical protein